jgi:hypothetical protein
MNNPNMIFVFGSNEAGRHGAGAAREALLHYEAKMYQGFGPQGRCFAIPTKDWEIITLPVDVIKAYVDRFIVYARFRPTFDFQVTQLGCGLAGLRVEVIAPMFKYAPSNCYFDTAWKDFLPAKANFWGTFP